MSIREYIRHHIQRNYAAFWQTNENFSLQFTVSHNVFDFTIKQSPDFFAAESQLKKLTALESAIHFQELSFKFDDFWAPIQKLMLENSFIACTVMEQISQIKDFELKSSFFQKCAAFGACVLKKCLFCAYVMCFGVKISKFNF